MSGLLIDGTVQSDGCVVRELYILLAGDIALASYHGRPEKGKEASIASRSLIVHTHMCCKLRQRAALDAFLCLRFTRGRKQVDGQLKTLTHAASSVASDDRKNVQVAAVLITGK